LSPPRDGELIRPTLTPLYNFLCVCCTQVAQPNPQQIYNKLKQFEVRECEHAMSQCQSVLDKPHGRNGRMDRNRFWHRGHP